MKKFEMYGRAYLGVYEAESAYQAEKLALEDSRNVLSEIMVLESEEIE